MKLSLRDESLGSARNDRVELGDCLARFVTLRNWLARIAPLNRRLKPMSLGLATEPHSLGVMTGDAIEQRRHGLARQ